MRERANSILKHMLVMLAAVLLAGVFMAVRPEPAFAADNIASGGNGKLLWVIDSNGKLTVTGSGNVDRIAVGTDTENFSKASSLLVPEWHLYRAQIKSAEINVTGMTNARFLLAECSNLKSVDLSGFDTSSVTTMNGMFSFCSSLTALDLSGFDTSNVTNMNGMFYGCMSLTSLDVSSFETGNVTDMGGMFSECRLLTALDLSNFNTGNVTGMGSIFYFCLRLKKLDVSSFDTSHVEDMQYMFGGCASLPALDVSNFDTRNVENMKYMFWGCLSLPTLDVSSFDTGKVTTMYGMFDYCASLTALDVSNFDTGSVENMDAMFYQCEALTTLDVSSFDMSSVTTASMMFDLCGALTTIYAPYNVSVEIALPVSTDDSGDSDDIWYRSSGKAVTVLPKNTSRSVAIGKNYVPTEKTKLTAKNTTITFSKTAYTYNGEAKKPKLTVKNSDGKTISADNYSVTYKNNTKVGTATATIRFSYGYSGTVEKTFAINPKGTTLRTVSSPRTKVASVTWTKQVTQITGYQIQYAKDSKFEKSAETVTVKGTSATSKTLTKLTAKTKYYVRIRTYKTVDGKKYYSAWSKKMSVKTK